MSGGVATAVVYPSQMPPKQIINGHSANGWVNLAGSTNGISGVPVAVSSPLVANTLLQVISLTGPGMLDFLSIGNNNATARTIRCKVVLDGVTVFDSTSASISTMGLMCVIGMAGYFGGQNVIGSIDPMPFKSSCVVSVASSLSESNALQVQYLWRPA